MMDEAIRNRHRENAVEVWTSKAYVELAAATTRHLEDDHQFAADLLKVAARYLTKAAEALEELAAWEVAK